MKEIRDILQFWKARQGEPLALATLVAVQGSSYRRPGARMLIDGAGEWAGGVSAGCIEDEVIATARAVLRTGRPRLLVFDTRLRFGCHGTIEVFVELAEASFLAEWNAHFVKRQRCRMTTILDGQRRGTRIAGVDEALDGFVQTIEPPVRLILVGDSSDTAALDEQATLLGWDVLRMEIVPADLLDDRTAVVLATHNYGRDCAALRELLPSGLRYLGLVGSRRRRDDLLFDVLQDGVSLESELFAPAGLHLGAETPEEIATSIVAEIQRVFAAATGQSLRDRKAPIHLTSQRIVEFEPSAG